MCALMGEHLPCRKEKYRSVCAGCGFARSLASDLQAQEEKDAWGRDMDGVWASEKGTPYAGSRIVSKAKSGSFPKNQAVRRLFFLRCWSCWFQGVGEVLFSLSFRNRTVPVIPVHHASCFRFVGWFQFFGVSFRFWRTFSFGMIISLSL